MHWLFLDSSSRDLLRMAVLPASGRIRAKTVHKQRVNVPSTLAAFFDPEDLKNASGVCVVAGPGSFSAVRGGVLAGNLLARFLNIPLTGVSVDESVDLPALRHRLASGDVPAVSYVAPVYDAEPNITCPQP